MNYDLGFDDELPAGYQDADLEERELAAAANRAALLRARGVCDHGWIQGPPGPVGRPTKVWTCLHCGKTWATESAFLAAQEEAKELMA